MEGDNIWKYNLDKCNDIFANKGGLGTLDYTLHKVIVITILFKD